MVGKVIIRSRPKATPIWEALMSKSPFREQGELMEGTPATPLGWVEAKPSSIPPEWGSVAAPSARRLTPELMSDKPLGGRALLRSITDEGEREATVVEPTPDVLVGSAGDDTLDDAPAPRGGFLRRLADHPTMLAGISAGANTPGSFLTGLNAMASQGLAGAGQDEKISVLREQRAQAAKQRAAQEAFGRMIEQGGIEGVDAKMLSALHAAYPEYAGQVIADAMKGGDSKDRLMAVDGKIYDTASGTWITPPGEGGISNEVFDNQAKLRGEFVKAADDFEKVRNSYTRIKAAASETSGASDIAMIYSFMKMFDPTSVVREGEFATAANAGGIPDQIRSMYNRALSGERLTPDVRRQFLQQADAQYNAAQTQLAAIETQYRDLATRYGFNPALIVPDVRAGVTTGAEEAAVYVNSDTGEEIMWDGTTWVPAPVAK